MPKLTVLERLNARTDKTGDCWIWTGGQTSGSYGCMKVDGKVQRTHRIAYELAFGPIPEGMQVDHRCHNRLCVRPRHLRLVTNKQNAEHRSGPNTNSVTGARGVQYSRSRGVYVGTVWHHSKRIRVGLFNTLSEADAAVRAKRQELYTHDDATY